MKSRWSMAHWAGILVVTALRIVAPHVALAQSTPDADGDDGPAKPVTELIVTAKRLDAARANIEPSLGASTYTLTNETVESRPGSETTSINQVLLQAPGVQQDGSGQLHVRQSHGDLQYRINNVILPEGLSDLGESLSARMARRVQLVTGALPAQYGFQAGGVVNITTKNGAYLNGGQAEVYGGSHGEVEPAFEYGVSSGPTNLFISGSFQRNQAGLASPDGSARPSHDRTDQVDGFAFIDRILDSQTRVSLIFGLSDDRFQMPNRRGLDAASTIDPEATFQGPLTVGGVHNYDSQLLNDRRREATRYAIASLMRATDKATVQAAVFFRESVLSQRANGQGDLLFKGVGQDTDELSDAHGLQVEAVYELAAAHTLRAGVVASWDRSMTSGLSRALPVDAHGMQTSDVPRLFTDNAHLKTRKESAFVQDEWRPTSDLTVNFGLRLDDVRAVQHEDRLSPRFGVVWTLPSGAVIHAGYARYFLPAPQEGAGDTPSDFARTTAAPPTLRGDPLRSETDNYYDIGVERTFDSLTLGIGGYWRNATNLIADGQFGPANLSKAFNYERARIRGLEFTATYARGPFSAWSNLAIARGSGQGVVSNQYYFTPAQVAFLAIHSTALSQDQTYTASAGLSYRWRALRLSGDALYGSGLPRTRVGGAFNGAHLPAYAQLNLAVVYRVATFAERPLDVRLDIMNAFDARYRLRDGSGLGDGLAQWGPRRGLFVGVEQAF